MSIQLASVNVGTGCCESWRAGMRSRGEELRDNHYKEMEGGGGGGGGSSDSDEWKGDKKTDAGVGDGGHRGEE